jgi:HEAT repeat protein
MKKITFLAFVCVFAPVLAAAAVVDVKARTAELKDKSLATRLNAVSQLAKAPESDKALIDAYKDEKEPFVRIRILDALTAHQTEASLDAVIAGLKDPDPGVRSAAASDLAYFGGNPKAREALSGALNGDETEQVKKSVINTLTAVNGDTASGEIGKAMRGEKSRDVRKFAVMRLKKMNTPAAKAELKNFEKDPDKEISGLAKEKK